MIYGSTFSGVGGFDLACHRAGMTCAWQIELDEFRASILKRHWPEVPLYGDVFECGSTVDADAVPGERAAGRVLAGAKRRGERDDTPAWRLAEQRGAARGVERVRPVVHALPQVDLITGGSPCRDLSVAGARRGIDGAGTEDGSQLFFEFARLADELVRPGGWLLFENVPGLLNSGGGRDLAVLLRTLGDIGFHDLAWRVLDSRHLGVPQRRRRVFVLARRAPGSSARHVLLELEGGRWDPPASGEAGPVAPARAGGGAPGDSVSELIDAGELTQALTARFGTSGSDLPDAEANWLVANPVESRPLVGLYSHGVHWSHDASPTIDTRVDESFVHAPEDVVAVSENQRAEVLETPYSRQLTAGGGKPGQGYPAARIGSVVRRLTPTETERLQGFPDGWTIPRGESLADAPSWYQLDPADVPRHAEDPPPHGPRYEACGRAVTVPVISWIVDRLVRYTPPDPNEPIGPRRGEQAMIPGETVYTGADKNTAPGGDNRARARRRG